MKRRGFTLMEVTVVIAVLVITAVMIMPAISRQKGQITQRDFVPALRRIVSSARTAAIDQSVTTYLSWDDSQAKVILYKQGTADGGDEQLTSISVPNAFTTNSFVLNGESSNSGDWKLHFYPDGSSETGGVEFTDNGKTQYMLVNIRGIGQLAGGSLPETSSDHWPAGDYEHRQ